MFGKNVEPHHLYTVSHGLSKIEWCFLWSYVDHVKLLKDIWSAGWAKKKINCSLKIDVDYFEILNKTMFYIIKNMIFQMLLVDCVDIRCQF